MLEEYVFNDILERLNRQKAVEELKIKIKQKEAGVIQSVSGDLILPDIELVYYFDQQHLLQIDYSFSDNVSSETRKFWESIIIALIKSNKNLNE